MDSNQILSLLDFENVINIAIKLLAIVFSLFYLIYSLVMAKQTQVMTNTIEIKYNNLLSLTALVQFVLGVVLVVYSVILL